MNYISTGKAARLLSVTPDTVLKWIKKGKIAARRTAGGHYRIAQKSIDELLSNEIDAPRDNGGDGSNGSDSLPACWDYHSMDGRIKEQCLSCLVFKVRGSRCYEIGDQLKADGVGEACCTSECEDCSYYKERNQSPAKTLVFTDDTAFSDSLTSGAKSSRLQIRFTNCEYDCSLLIDTFRPEFIVVDCAGNAEEFEEICDHLMSDPRLADANILLALPAGEGLKSGRTRGAATVNHPFTLGELEIFVENYDMLRRVPAE